MLTTQRTTTRHRLQAIIGCLAVLGSAFIVLTLDIYTREWLISPAARTISEYVFTRLRWPFYLSALLLAGGSLLVLKSAITAKITTIRSSGSAGIVAWSGGLALVVLFEKHDWSIGASLSGYIHQLGSLIAFVALPIAGIMLTRPYQHHARARIAQTTAWLCCLWYPVLFVTVMLSVTTEVRWWELVPLGAVERILIGSEILIIVALAWWIAGSSTIRPSLVGSVDDENRTAKVGPVG